MSTYVFANGHLDLNDDTPVSVLYEVVGLLDNTEGIYNVYRAPLEIDKIQCRMVDFQMEGYNGVDYTPLETLIPELEKLTGGITLQTSEFMQTQEGFYYDTDEEKDDEANAEGA